MRAIRMYIWQGEATLLRAVVSKELDMQSVFCCNRAAAGTLWISQLLSLSCLGFPVVLLWHFFSTSSVDPSGAAVGSIHARTSRKKGSQLMFSKKELDWWPHLPLTCPLGASSLSPQILIVKGRDPLIFFLFTLQPSWRGQKYHLSLNTCPSKLNLFITAKNVYFLFFTKYVFSAFGEKWS